MVKNIFCAYSAYTNKTYKAKDTQSCSFVLGVYPGYDHNNAPSASDAVSDSKVKSFDIFAADINNTIKYLYDIGCIRSQIPFILTPVKAIYGVNHGCPQYGEDCYKFETDSNIKYDKKEQWVEDCMVIATYLKSKYKQFSLTVIFTDFNGKKRMVCI